MSLPLRLRTASALGIITASFVAGTMLPTYTPQPPRTRNPATIPSRAPHPTTILAMLSASSFLFVSVTLVRTLEQRRGELFALAALFSALATAIPPIWKSAPREDEGGKGWGWKGWSSLVGALVGAWATLGDV